MDSVCGNEDLPFIVMMNVDDLVAGRDPNASEIATTAASRTVTLTFSRQTMDIFIGAFSSPSLSTCNSLTIAPMSRKMTLNMMLRIHSMLEILQLIKNGQESPSL